jgi:glycosyltransferase involved in cell wall biosynthesis
LRRRDDKIRGVNRRILFLITDLEIGGTPTVVRELARRLRSPDVHVEVACLKKRGPVADQLQQSGIDVTAMNLSSAWQLPTAIARLRTLVRDRQIDTVFSFLVHANALAAMASRKLPDVRFFQAIQTVQHWPRWHWRVQRIAAKSAERIVVPSSAVAKMAQQQSGIDLSKIAVIPNAVDPDEFPRVQTFQRTPLHVGFLGRLDRVKKLPELVMAMWMLRDRGDIHCHIFGYGPEARTVVQLADRAGLMARIFLRGPVSRPQEALREMDMLVLPTPYEGFGLVLIEAMASGVPVIAACKGGAVDIVQNEVNGLTVGHRYYDREIQAVVRRLVDEPELRNRLIENGIKTVREKFRWDVVLPQYQELLGVRVGE